MIISCSRRTDIPAFYSDWFFNRIARRICPGAQSDECPGRSGMYRLPLRMLTALSFGQKTRHRCWIGYTFCKDYNYYFQFTLTPYDKDIEPNLPPKTEIIDTFLKLSDKIGTKRVIWRYDPILLSPSINIDYHIQHFADLAKRLSGHTEKCVISFLDMYRHLQSKSAGLSIRPPDEAEMRSTGRRDCPDCRQP